jgi:hypothetical protein
MKKPLDACLQTFAKGRLAIRTPGSLDLVLDPAGADEGRAVLRTFHALHASWLAIKDFPVLDVFGRERRTRAIFDPTNPASYFTRALLSPTANLTSVVQGNDYLTPLRTVREPAEGAGFNHTLPSFVHPTGPRWTSPEMRFADRGALEGLKIEPTNKTWSFTWTQASNPPPNQPPLSAPTTGTLRPYVSLGGGILGNGTYIQMNAQISRTMKKDGAVNVPRKWSRSVVQDLLCRSLPVLRPADVSMFVNAQSPTTFRSTEVCTSCHATMDPLAGLVRAAEIPFKNLLDHPPETLIFTAATEPAHPAVWTDREDPLYAQRPATGRFIYRDRSDRVVNSPVANMDALGAALLTQDDFYSCFAARYYEYFIGVSVERVLSGSSRHSPHVRALADQLKADKNLAKLVERILSLPHYGFSDFEPN